ncbi:uncharacterized protein SPAPADRAFT_60424 [Spathaspora passalidarum NRRL Y-27907]|uniref:NADH dehydrogenase [ubiquinone] 1 alpha subcomplex assembly factor 3 n=1 Tax=Spathaspora passalidarum (strain NRRL Y-27907 / 11-Y1) TaxID=619300 RepID=G3AL68_SPAPN|nr:uncharacterized protein SPAPADRAFT_60424 [Spathaspora passalidarum NRRL Y-27907]EGW33111.1 hypothetical protein SPAPADRAFT_60424 [Spathaspora passalidarum NRRL Y-27907]
MFRQTIIRRFCTTPAYLNKGFGAKSLKPHAKQILGNPGNKQPTSNPADMFKRNDVLMYSDKPINYIESVKPDGFHFFNTMLITSPDKQGKNVGAILLGTEVYEVNLDNLEIDNVRVNFPSEVLKIFKKVYPKPEIVVIGLGKQNRILMPETKNVFSELGIQTEVGDSSSAASVFDLLATERPNVIGALLLPPNL